MSRQTTPSPPAAPAVTDASTLFNRWQVYQSIIDHDWMRHREIHAAIHAFVKASYQTRFSLLDLGCGNAGSIRRTFEGTPLAHYTGVDLAPAALEEARRQLAPARFGVTLVAGEFLATLADVSAQPHHGYELILAGYAVHHLSADGKQRFFTLCRRVLGWSGALVLYDVFRRPGEGREEYLAAYTALMEHEWGLAGEALADTSRHVRECDFPETVAATHEMARRAGFEADGRELYGDGFHRLLCFVP